MVAVAAAANVTFIAVVVVALIAARNALSFQFPRKRMHVNMYLCMHKTKTTLAGCVERTNAGSLPA